MLLSFSTFTLYFKCPCIYAYLAWKQIEMQDKQEDTFLLWSRRWKPSSFSCLYPTSFDWSREKKCLKPLLLIHKNSTSIERALLLFSSNKRGNKTHTWHTREKLGMKSWMEWHGRHILYLEKCLLQDVKKTFFFLSFSPSLGYCMNTKDERNTLRDRLFLFHSNRTISSFWSNRREKKSKMTSQSVLTLWKNKRKRHHRRKKVLTKLSLTERKIWTTRDTKSSILAIGSSFLRRSTRESVDKQGFTLSKWDYPSRRPMTCEWHSSD
jgi:hypothetical protein